MKEGRYDGEDDDSTMEKAEEAAFDKFVAECEEDTEKGKEILTKVKTQKNSGKLVTVILKKLGTKLQKLAITPDLNEDGITGAMINLIMTRSHLAQLVAEEKMDENTPGSIFEKTWNWEDTCGTFFRKELEEMKDQGGRTILKVIAEKSDDGATSNLKEQIQEEFGNYYNKKVIKPRNNKMKINDRKLIKRYGTFKKA